jgi:TonB family protein
MRSTLCLSTILALALSGAAVSTSAQQTTPPAATQPQRFIAVSAGVAAARRISGNSPEYPAIAKAAKVQGTVVLYAEISKDGTIQNLRVISGPPMLQSAALDAVRTWTYKPYLLNGEPVAVRTQINIVFNLAPSESAAAPGAHDLNGQQISVQNLPVVPSDQIPPSPPAHPVTAEQVHELLQLTGALQIMKQMMDAMMPAIRQQMPPYMPDDVLTDFQKSFVGANLEDAITRVYQQHVSTEDAAAAIAFYKTPAGQRMMSVQPTLEKELQEEGRQLAVQTMMEVLERHKSEIDDAKKQYNATHLWTPPKN